MAKFCRKCGVEADENEKTCPNCGAPLDTAIRGLTVSSVGTHKRASSRGCIMIIIRVLLVFSLVVGGIYWLMRPGDAPAVKSVTTQTAERYNNIAVPEKDSTDREQSNVEKKIFSTDLGKSDENDSKKAAELEKKTGNEEKKPANEEHGEKEELTGVITGDGVMMRSSPSTAGDQVGVLLQNKEVKILGKYTCDDESAAILSVNNISVKLPDGTTSSIERGLALKIIEETSDGYKCSLGDGIIAELPKDAVRKLYGEVWYHVETDGIAGYVFGNYVSIK